MSPEETLSQVRQAHRICASFYQRMMPLINNISEELELNFVSWAPRTFNRPTRKTTNPLTYWSWDYLPLISAGFIFSSQEQDGEIKQGDYILDIELVADAELDCANINRLYGKTQPDATNLHISSRESHSFLKIYLFHANTPLSGNAFDTMWKECNYPELNEVIQAGNKNVDTVGFILPITEIMNDDGVTLAVDRINQHLELMQK